MSKKCKDFRQKKVATEEAIIEEYASYFNNGLEENWRVMCFTNGTIISRDLIGKIIKRTGEKGTEAKAIYNLRFRKTAGYDAGKTVLACFYHKPDVVAIASTYGYDFASPDDAQAFIDEFEGMNYNKSEYFTYTEEGFYYNLNKSLKSAYQTIAEAKKVKLNNQDKTK